MESKKALKLIDKILGDLDHAGIVTNTLIEDLKTLRPYAIEEEIPLVVKVIRYTYEHIEANDTFLVPIPDDEPIEVEEGKTVETIQSDFDSKDSLAYLISLMKDTKNKMNISDLRDYRDALLQYGKDN